MSGQDPGAKIKGPKASVAMWGGQAHGFDQVNNALSKSVERLLSGSERCDGSKLPYKTLLIRSCRY